MATGRGSADVLQLFDEVFDMKEENVNDDIVGYLFSECMKKIALREMPTEEELEAANIELRELNLRIVTNEN